MIYYLSQQMLEWLRGTPWADHLSALRLFHYITVRSAGAAITALMLSWWLGPRIIHWLKQLKFGQDYADRAEEAGGLAARVLSKKGTPTMGGILIVAVLFISTLLWTQLDNKLVLLTLLSVLVLSGLGFYDDYAKIIQQTGGGTPPRVKLVAQFALATFIGVYLWMTPSTSKLVSEIMIPFCKHPVATGAGLIGLLVVVLAIVGSSNAVNLTDGLDGLAICKFPMCPARAN
jgi:phospho-N-acetylmuramoyl-pentapeptide-transferase